MNYSVTRDAGAMIRVGVAGAAGRMGSLIVRRILESDDMELTLAVDAAKAGDVITEGVSIMPPSELDAALRESGPDVLIDFTTADAAEENVKTAAMHGVRLVVGTTGFKPGQREDISKTVKSANIPAVISPNFAMGVNIFWKMIVEAARLLPGAEIEIVEAHHHHKKDAPSGTALRAKKLIDEALGTDVPVHSIRSGDIVGDHVVLLAAEGERLEIKHQAHSRDAFVAGVLTAVRWIMSAAPGEYAMDDVLGLE